MATEGDPHPMQPQPPPEAVLLRRVRKAAGATVEETAKGAGISKAWLSSIEAGYDTRAASGVRPVRAKDEVIARVAAFLRISPERLEREGQRPDAARVLAEIQRRRDDTALRGGDDSLTRRWKSFDRRKQALALSFLEALERDEQEHAGTEESA